MDRTVVLAVALGLGSLLLWSLMILVEDMSSTRRNRGRHRPTPGPVQWADLPIDQAGHYTGSWSGDADHRRRVCRRDGNGSRSGLIQTIGSDGGNRVSAVRTLRGIPGCGERGANTGDRSADVDTVNLELHRQVAKSRGGVGRQCYLALDARTGSAARAGASMRTPRRR